MNKKITYYKLEIVFTNSDDLDTLLYFIALKCFKSLDYVIQSSFDVENENID